MNKTAIITGTHGQDGSYLAEYLLGIGYKVYGVSRRTSSRTNEFLYSASINPNFTLVNLDITDPSGITEMISDIKPNEYYNLAAMSHVGQSFKEPISTLKTDGEAVTIALDAIMKYSPNTRFYQASTSELFGNSPGPQSESTTFAPRSPYAAAKLYAHKMVGLYREAYGMHASCGILFNHESPRRGLDFVTRKITRGVAMFMLTGEKFTIGNLDAQRDWGHAKEYVQVMHKMLQQEVPDDYVIGTGETASIKDAIDYVCELADIKEEPYVQDPKLIRPAEVNRLIADPSKAHKKLGWKAKIRWKDLLAEMLDSDVQALGRNSVLDML
jgi:GDPmannose 4,6-dehydratase